MSAHRISGKLLFAVFVATVAGLIAREAVRTRLIAAGFPNVYSADLSYMVVPPILLLILFPAWQSEKGYLAKQFSTAALSWKLVLTAISVGVLLRTIWWCQLVAGVAFGIYSNADAQSAIAPTFRFACPEPVMLATGFIVMAVLVPVTEEVIHRGYFLGGFERLGAVRAIVLSATLFMIFHKYDGWLFVFFGGVIFGIQYWYTKAVWASLISHATFNGIIQFDWRCLTTRWNPPASELPLIAVGAIASTLLVVCLVLLAVLLRQMAIGAHEAPR